MGRAVLCLRRAPRRVVSHLLSGHHDRGYRGALPLPALRALPADPAGSDPRAPLRAATGARRVRRLQRGDPVVVPSGADGRHVRQGGRGMVVVRGLRRSGHPSRGTPTTPAGREPPADVAGDGLVRLARRLRLRGCIRCLALVHQGPAEAAGAGGELPQPGDNAAPVREAGHLGDVGRRGGARAEQPGGGRLPRGGSAGPVDRGDAKRLPGDVLGVVAPADRVHPASR